jgi:site-specific recombinase XerD
MQKQFLQMVMKQKNLHLDNEQYQQINNYLQQLQLEEEKELDDIAARIFTNQEETKRLSDQLMSKKLLDFYKENAGIKTKKVNYDAFVKEAYGSAQ